MAKKRQQGKEPERLASESGSSSSKKPKSVSIEPSIKSGKAKHNPRTKAVRKAPESGITGDLAPSKKSRTHVPQETQTSKPLNFDTDAEVDFPRGGVRVVAPLESYRIRKVPFVEKEHLFGTAEDNAGRESRKKHKQTKKKPGSKYGDDEEKDDDRGTAIKRVDRLNFKRLNVGMVVLGAVRDINELDMVISLPNNLTGVVRFTDISDPLSDAISRQSLRDSSEGEGEEEDEVPALSDLFYVGQLVRAVVTALVNDAGARRVELSLKPSAINAGLTREGIRQGMQLYGCIKTIEDHGYTVSFGVRDVTGLLLNKHAQKYRRPAGVGLGGTSDDASTSAERLRVGQVFECVVLAVNSALRTVSVSIDSSAAAAALAKEEHGLEMQTLKAGTLVNGRVTKILSNGIVISFLGVFTATVDLMHLGHPAVAEDSIDKLYSVDQKVRARLLYVDPQSKAIGASLRPQLVALEPCSFPDAVRIGTVVDDAIMRRIDAAIGMLLEVPLPPDLQPLRAFAYVHISRAADEHVDKLEKQFRVGGRYRLRVLSHDQIDGVVNATTAKSVIDQPILRYSDIKPAMLLKGKVLAVEKFGMLVALTDSIKALCPRDHLADVRLQKPQAKFKVGAEVTCRVLTQDTSARKVTVTHKRTLVESELPAVTAYEEAVPGLITHGFISTVKDFGCLVNFYGGVHGLVPLSELGVAVKGYGKEDEGAAKPAVTECFSVGQVVKCRVVACDPAAAKLRLSFVLKPRKGKSAAKGGDGEATAEGGADTDGEEEADTEVEEESQGVGGRVVAVESGAVVSGTVTEVTDTALIVTLEGGGGEALLADAHLSDHPSHIATIKTRLGPGSTLHQLLVITRAHPTKGGRERAVVSMKPSLIQGARHGLMPGAISDVRPGTVVCGYVKNVTPFGVFVSFLNAVVGLAPKGHLSDAFVTDPAEIYKEGQTVRAYVESVDADRGRVTLSLKQSACAAPDVSWLSSLFAEEHDHALVAIGQSHGRKKKSKSKGGAAAAAAEADADTTGGKDKAAAVGAGAGDEWEGVLVGGCVNATVQAIKDYGVILALPHQITAFAHTPHSKRAHATIKSGETVRARVLDVNREKRIVDVSLKPEHVAAGDSQQSNGARVSGTTKKKSKGGAGGGVPAPGEEVNTVVELVKEDYLVVSLPQYASAIAFISLNDYNFRLKSPHLRFTVGQHVRATVRGLSVATSRLLLSLPYESLLDSRGRPSVSKSGGEGQCETDDSKYVNKGVRRISDVHAGMLLACKVTGVSKDKTHVGVTLGPHLPGRIHASEVVDLAEVDPPRAGPVAGDPLARFTPGQILKAKVVHVETSEHDLPHETKKKHTHYLRKMVELTVRASELVRPDMELATTRPTLASLRVGERVVAVVERVLDNGDGLYLQVGAHIKGRVFATDASNDPSEVERLGEVFAAGQVVVARVLRVVPEKLRVDLALKEGVASTEVAAGTVVVGRVHKELPKGAGVIVQIGPGRFGRVSVAELSDPPAAPSAPALGTVVRCCVLSVSGDDASRVDLSLRPSRIANPGDQALAVIGVVDESPGPAPAAGSDADKPQVVREVASSKELRAGMRVRGVVKNIAESKGLFLSLGAGVTARALISNLSDKFIRDLSGTFPPGKIVDARILKVDDQSGRIEVSLKQSVVDGQTGGRPAMTLDHLKPGMVISGRVKKVESYGVFVAVGGAASLTGLAHISELSDDFVKDIGDVVTVGDRVRAVVLKVDPLTRRISLSLKPTAVEKARAAGGADAADDKPALTESSASSADDQSEPEGSAEDGAEPIDEDEDDDAAHADDSIDGEDDGGAGTTPGLFDDDDQSSAAASDDDDDAAAAALESEDAEGADGDEADSSEDRDRDGDEDGDEDGYSQSDDERAAGEADEDGGRLDVSAGFGWGGDGDGDGTAMDSGPPAEDDADESDAVAAAGTGALRKLAKKKKRNEDKEEAALRQREEALLENAAPQTAEDFERVAVANPNSSYLWIAYMAYMLSLTETEKARLIAERALKTMSVREEQERLNVWVALMNLEHSYGTKESLQAVFQRALSVCDPKKLHLLLLGIYERAADAEMTEQLYETMTKRFRTSSKVWIRYLEATLKGGRPDAAARLLQRALAALPSRKHVKTISKFAQLEFKEGSAERGRTIFEGILRNYPKRVDLWSVYLDMELRLLRSPPPLSPSPPLSPDMARRLLERVVRLNLSSKKMKFFFTRYLDFEKTYGNETTVEHVRALAREYLDSKAQ